MSKKKFVIDGLSEASNCPLCLDQADGRSKEKRPVVFNVISEGSYSGPCCPAHLAAIIKAAEGQTAVTPAVANPASPARAVQGPESAPKPPAAVPAGNSQK